MTGIYNNPFNYNFQTGTSGSNGISRQLQVKYLIETQLKNQVFESMDGFKEFCGDFYEDLNICQVYGNGTYNYYKVSSKYDENLHVQVTVKAEAATPTPPEVEEDSGVTSMNDMDMNSWIAANGITIVSSTTSGNTNSDTDSAKIENEVINIIKDLGCKSNFGKDDQILGLNLFDEEGSYSGFVNVIKEIYGVDLGEVWDIDPVEESDYMDSYTVQDIIDAVTEFLKGVNDTENVTEPETVVETDDVEGTEETNNTNVEENGNSNIDDNYLMQIYPEMFEIGVLDEELLNWIEENSLTFVEINKDKTDIDEETLQNMCKKTMAKLAQHAYFLGYDQIDYINKHLAESMEEPSAAPVAQARGTSRRAEGNSTAAENVPDYIKNLIQEKYGDDVSYKLASCGSMIYVISNGDTVHFIDYISNDYIVSFPRDDGLGEIIYTSDRHGNNKCETYIETDMFLYRLYKDYSKDNPQDRTTFKSGKAIEALEYLMNEHCTERTIDIINSIAFDFVSGNQTAAEVYIDLLNDLNNESNEKVANWFNNLAAKFILASEQDDLIRLYNNNSQLKNTLSVLHYINVRDISQNSDKFSWNPNGTLGDTANYQGSTGSCWVLAPVDGMVTGFPEILDWIKENCIKIDNKSQTYTVIIQGREFTYTFDQIKNATELSEGDIDIRVFEMAARELWSIIGGDDSFEGGNMRDFVKILTGSEDGVNEYDADDLDTIIEIIKSGDYIGYMSSYEDIPVYDSKTGEKIDFITGHAYNVIRYDEEYIYIRNPHDTSKTLKIKISDLKDCYFAYNCIKKKTLIEALKKANDPNTPHDWTPSSSTNKSDKNGLGSVPSEQKADFEAQMDDFVAKYGEDPSSQSLIEFMDTWYQTTNNYSWNDMVTAYTEANPNKVVQMPDGRVIYQGETYDSLAIWSYMNGNKYAVKLDESGNAIFVSQGQTDEYGELIDMTKVNNIDVVGTNKSKTYTDSNGKQWKSYGDYVDAQIKGYNDNKEYYSENPEGVQSHTSVDKPIMGDGKGGYLINKDICEELADMLSTLDGFDQMSELIEAVKNGIIPAELFDEMDADLVNMFTMLANSFRVNDKADNNNSGQSYGSQKDSLPAQLGFIYQNPELKGMEDLYYKLLAAGYSEKQAISIIDQYALGIETEQTTAKDARKAINQMIYIKKTTANTIDEIKRLWNERGYYGDAAVILNQIDVNSADMNTLQALLMIKNILDNPAYEIDYEHGDHLVDGGFTIKVSEEYADSLYENWFASTHDENGMLIDDGGASASAYFDMMETLDKLREQGEKMEKSIKGYMGNDVA